MRILPPVGVAPARREGKVKPKILESVLLTQIENAEPISRCERGNDSELTTFGQGLIGVSMFNLRND